MKCIFMLSILFLMGCSGTRVINENEQTFTEYVVLNKNSDWQGSGFEDLDSDCFHS